ncbi:unnamed protein product [Triticum turgidum subsp. durum]|uniref:Uncharacterized protein n=1 Tax=Triticum turgidum subsp. durum TaxID=4567 RepID=A0A9R0ZHD6_TRITD|nr:unnamed protein product [Triticum turgidum subsp. durum]
MRKQVHEQLQNGGERRGPAAAEEGKRHWSKGITVEVMELREGFGGRPGRSCNGIGERENRCKERGRVEKRGPEGVLGRPGMLESYLVLSRLSQSLPSLLPIYGKK